MDLEQFYPSIADLARRARRRVPRFVWEFLESGTGDDRTHSRNAEALDRVLLTPKALGGAPEPVLETELFGTRYALPFGFAPVGMAGLIWPGAEVLLARAAAERGVPVCLSTVAAETPETVGPLTGGMGWFQLYAPQDADTRRDILARARDSGFTTLVLTADVPVASRRERQRRADIRNPAVITPSIFVQCALRPEWSLRTLHHGKPTLVTLHKYIDTRISRPGGAHAGYMIRAAADLDYLRATRDEWDGPLVVKGVLDPDSARDIVAAGADAIWVSNHGGRQFDAAPASIEVLPAIRAALGPEATILFDSGIRSGTDILRAMALGADFCMVGRAGLYGVAAFGQQGAAHVLTILENGLRADLGQLGLARPADAASRRHA